MAENTDGLAMHIATTHYRRPWNIPPFAAGRDLECAQPEQELHQRCL